MMLAAARKQQEEEAQPEQNGPELPNARPLPFSRRPRTSTAMRATFRQLLLFLRVRLRHRTQKWTMSSMPVSRPIRTYASVSTGRRPDTGCRLSCRRACRSLLRRRECRSDRAAQTLGPERPTRAVFDKEFKNANDKSVDLKDSRYHLVVQDASAEDMDEEDYLAQIEAARIAESVGDDGDAPRKKVKMDAAFEPGTLKKSRLRGKASQRQAARVWFYKPKERLDTTHSKLQQYQTTLPSKEHELAFLRQQLDEGLAVDTNAETVWGGRRFGSRQKRRRRRIDVGSRMRHLLRAKGADRRAAVLPLVLCRMH